MRLKRILIIFAVVATVAMVGCRTVSSEPPSSPKETQEMSTVVTETEVSETTESTTEAQEATETIPDEAEEDYFQSDDFILVNSPDFEPFEFFGRAHLQTILEREGVNNGIDFFMRTKPETIKVGKIGDVVVGQVQMDDDDVVWNVRIEKADDFVNNTGIDMSNAESILVGKDDIVRTIGGMTFIERDYRIDLTNEDELDALYEATGVWDVTKIHSIEIRMFLNKTKSTLFTIYSHVYWEQHGEDTFGPPIKRDPIGMMKSEANYQMEAYQEELDKRTEELKKKFE